MKVLVTSNSPVAEADQPATEALSARPKVESALAQTIGLTRVKVGFSIDALAAIAEIPTARLVSIESGAVRPSAEELYKISQSLNHQISFFFTVT